ncbi:MAG: hypothetical protein LBS62_06690 [Clostridiales bacterium]|jgi:hypothetical protein|nr:hypothetical protein [Clostridiales bacterium]
MSGKLSAADGSTYIYVIITMISVFVLLSICLHTANTSMTVSRAHDIYLDMYPMAVSGVEKAADILNTMVWEKREAIFQSALEKLCVNGFEGTAVYRVPDVSEPYQGEFFLKDNIFARYFAEAALEEVFTSSEAGTSEGMSFMFDQLMDEPHGEGTRDCSVQVKAVADSKGCNVESAALRGDLRVVAEGRIDFMPYKGGEMLTPIYGWRDAPYWAEYGASEYATVMGQAELSGSEFPGEWSETVPVEARGVDILDVSGFYGSNGEPVSTIVLDLTLRGSPLTLRASDSSRNAFYGLVFSKNDVILDNIIVTGSVVSAGGIIYPHSLLEFPLGAAGVIVPDPDALFKIKFADSIMQKKIFDILGVTDFAGSFGPEVETEAENVLGQLVISRPARLTLAEDGPEGAPLNTGFRFEVVTIRKRQ